MSTRRTFGNTWWGKQWLATLNNIDNANCLTQGRYCYLRGNVESFEWIAHEQRIEAFVSGSAYFPYQVNIELPKWSKQKTKQLLDAIAKDPLLVSELLQGTLSPAIATLCDQINLDLFPDSWRSMHTGCTCSEQSSICKHIVAVFYCLTEHIDADPFLIFKLHGLDLQNELRQRGIDLCEVTTACPLTFSELALAATEDFASPKKLDSDVALDKLRHLPYGTFESLRETFLSLLPVSLSTPGDQTLRENFRLLLVTAEQTLKRIFPYNHTQEWFDRCIAPYFFSRNSFFEQEEIQALDMHLSVKITDLAEFQSSLSIHAKTSTGKSHQTTLKDPAAIFAILLKMPALWAREADPILECWREITQLAAQLVIHSLIVPALITSKNNPSCLPLLVWTPAVRDTHTANLVSLLTQACEPFSRKLLDRGTHVQPKNIEKANVFLALSTAISALVKFATINCKALNRTSSVLLLLAMQTPVDNDREIPASFLKSMLRGLNAFLLGSSYPWRPILTVHVHKEGIKINFGIIARDSVSAETESTGMPSHKRALTSSPLSAKRPVMLSRLLRENSLQKHRFAAVSVLKTLTAACPMLAPIAATQGKPITLPYNDLKTFLFDITPTLTLLGVSVMLPIALKRLLKPQLVVHVQAGTSNSLLDKNAFSNFDWRAAIGEHELSLNELLALAEKAGQVVRINEDFVYLDAEQLHKLIQTIKEQPQPTYLEKMRAVLCGTYAKNGIPTRMRIAQNIIKRIEALTAVEELSPPKNLQAALRPYQKRGFSWLMKNLRLGIGALIADDMGLGKTLQVIAALVQLKNDGELQHNKVLIVVPTTLLTNWSREIAKFAPTLSVGIYHGSKRTLPANSRDLPDLTLTSYGLMRRDTEKLASFKWRLLVLDEAQALKNSATSQTIAAKAIHAAQTIAMTGTPVENRLSEYRSILETVQPHLFGSEKDFQETFARPIEVDHNPLAIESFRRLTSPFMLRRVKSDKSIIADLPERHTIDLFTHLSLEQAALYQKELDKYLKKIRTLETNANNEIDKHFYQHAKQGEVLKLITSMKQICNSPSQYLKTKSVFPDSGKAASLFELLEQCREAGRKVLIFTQYREMGELLQAWIGKVLGDYPDFLHGGIPLNERQNMVDRFQTNRSVRTLIVSLKAGGTGLNLTAASCVIHYDLWWNPAVETQATDRAYRIGQQRDVLVYRFITEGTFEERINEMLQHKRNLADLSIVTGETWIGDLSVTELQELFSLKRPPIN